ncbi:DUF2849 domain-containing protein [Parafrankia sp. BMG5.11]|jgi:hypothetical protein|uniref:DUF2849 domain-containing protein n=1 Tax=Parafrankia sp. BMG5.11 TaxID=222540 RepID=UPI001039FB56|nr:DUF2849 domain-containing protein [Parafrankia sp. BMG5.11]TCJ38237.1 DUF2849 domain-containing protein [Parafrankia sp. BMG5.11]
MRIITGNDLKTGAVTWWTGVDWSLHVADAVDAGADAEAIMARETATCRVNNPYIIDGEKTAEGVRPAHIKDRVRALGPTVRPDLMIKPADPDLREWVI